MPERPPRRVVLVGFMGAGKTSVGRELAALAGWSFLDLDARVEERFRMSVAEIFRERGEAAFRQAEREAALEAMARERCVVAAGGGAFAEEATRAVLRAGAATVYLRCDLDTLLQRVAAGAPRPLAGNRETMARLLSSREGAYRSADVTLDATLETPAALAVMIARALGIEHRERAEGR